MKAGTVLRRFKARDGSTVTLRALQWSDIDDLLELINSLVDEDAYINKDAKMTREAQVDWIARKLTQVEKDERAVIVAEVEGKAVGLVEVWPSGSGHLRHVGELGISVRSSHRGIGVGTELMWESDAQAKRLGLNVMTLAVVADNRGARRLYEKVGYHVTGHIPRAHPRAGEYLDVVIMVKESLA